MRHDALLLTLVALPLASFCCPVSGRPPDRITSQTNFPRLDYVSGCRDVAKTEVRTPVNYQHCINEEHEARAQLGRDWAKFPSDMRDQCISLVTRPALPSYVTLQQCLTMARDAENLRKKDGDKSVGLR
jgi:hypothetical protein